MTEKPQVVDETLESPDSRQKGVPEKRRPMALWITWSPDASQVGRFYGPPISEPMYLGRSDGNAIVIDDPWLSSQHVKMSPAAQGALRIEDLDTRNGSFLNRGDRFKTATMLPGDVLRCGATLLVLEEGAPAGDDKIVGLSRNLENVRTAVREAATASFPVHITGESGVGKEVAAQELHNRSGRPGKMVAVNMAAISAALAESQLFGHVKGAFTGATRTTQGFFQEADKGTLFLDEIGDCSEEIQAKLLRVLETGKVFRVGATEPQEVDVRLVTATNRDLYALVSDKAFREDLYWRLVHTTVRIDPLRQRRLDIVPLIEHFLARQGSTTTQVVVAERPESRWQVCSLVEALLTCSWPGNARQLRNEVHRLGRALTRPGADVPGPEQCFSGEVTSSTERAGVDRASASIEVFDRDTCEAWLEDGDALLEAILTRARGNIAEFARQIAPVVKKQPDSLRRTIYRRLGDDRLARLRVKK
jgi:DNA-binding NtrC family response regulator